MASDDVAKGQLLPSLGPLVAGTKWGQLFILDTIIPSVQSGGIHFSYETYDNMGMVYQGTTKRAIFSESKQLSPASAGLVTTDLDDYSAKIPIDVVKELKPAQDQDRLRPIPALGLNSVDRLRLGRARIIQYNNQMTKELAAAAMVFGTDSFNSDLQHDLDFATCKIEDVLDANNDVSKRFGVIPDTWVLGWKSWLRMLRNEEILGRITGGATVSNPAIVTLQWLAALFGFKRIAVGMSQLQQRVGPGETPPAPVPVWTENRSAAIYTGDFDSADLANPVFGKQFYEPYPETGLRYAVRQWINDEGNVEWIKAAELTLIARIMQAGFLFGKTD